MKILCKECQREFDGKYKSQKYCGRVCFHSAHKRWAKSPDGQAKLLPTLRTDNWTGKVRLNMRGDKHWFWKGGGRRSERAIAMSRTEYKTWRRCVFERDNFTCVECGKRGGDLEADHIKSWCDYPELRFDIENGRTLCVGCHLETPNWGRKGRPLRENKLTLTQ